MLLITHDLGVVANVADEIVVMYRGEVMESGTLSDIFERARHPYLQALLRAVPRFDMKPGERLQPIRQIPPGDAPHLMADKPAVAERPGAALLECLDIRKSFGLRSGGMFRVGTGARVMAVDGVSLRDRARRMPRPCRRERLRQDDAEQGADARGAARFGPHHL